MSTAWRGVAVAGVLAAMALAAYVLRRPSGPSPRPAVRYTASGPDQLGQPFADLSAADLAAFEAGQQRFREALPAFGPLYNDATCANCHAIPTMAGSGDLAHAAYVGPGTDTEVHFYRTRALPGWTVEPRPPTVGPRLAPPLYGLGLVEQIPDATIRAACGRGHPDPAKPQGSLPRNLVSRFGIKPFLGTLVDFVGSELLAQSSVTNSMEGTEDWFGRDDDAHPDPETHRDLAESLAAYVRGLRPPGRDGTDAAGEAAFRSFGCAVCHVPDMPPALDVFSDFCVHHMGEAFADGIVDHSAQSDEFRTTPLWGLRFRPHYLHDGRATTLDDAIAMHGGEADGAAKAYQHASDAERAALRRFLATL
ncbi:MAG: di-heme oxidoredictase family protein [bacterium]